MKPKKQKNNSFRSSPNKTGKKIADMLSAHKLGHHNNAKDNLDAIEEEANRGASEEDISPTRNGDVNVSTVLPEGGLDQNVETQEEKEEILKQKAAKRVHPVDGY